MLHPFAYPIDSIAPTYSPLYWRVRKCRLVRPSLLCSFDPGERHNSVSFVPPPSPPSPSHCPLKKLFRAGLAFFSAWAAPRYLGGDLCVLFVCVRFPIYSLSTTVRLTGLSEEFVQCGNFRGSKTRGRKFLRIYYEARFTGLRKNYQEIHFNEREPHILFRNLCCVQRETPNLTRDESIPVPFCARNI